MHAQTEAIVIPVEDDTVASKACSPIVHKHLRKKKKKKTTWLSLTGRRLSLSLTLKCYGILILQIKGKFGL